MLQLKLTIVCQNEFPSMYKFIYKSVIHNIEILTVFALTHMCAHRSNLKSWFEKKIECWDSI